jgi:hypothetical protein
MNDPRKSFLSWKLAFLGILASSLACFIGTLLVSGFFVPAFSVWKQEPSFIDWGRDQSSTEVVSTHELCDTQLPAFNLYDLSTCPLNHFNNSTFTSTALVVGAGFLSFFCFLSFFSSF